MSYAPHSSIEGPWGAHSPGHNLVWLTQINAPTADRVLMKSQQREGPLA